MPVKITTTKTMETSIELRAPYDDSFNGPVRNKDARALLLAGLRAVNPGTDIPDDVEITFCSRDIDFKWSEKVVE